MKLCTGLGGWICLFLVKRKRKACDFCLYRPYQATSTDKQKSFRSYFLKCLKRGLNFISAKPAKSYCRHEVSVICLWSHFGNFGNVPSYSSFLWEPQFCIVFWDHVGSNFSDLGQKGVPFFLTRTIQHCHLLTLTDEPAGPPSTLHTSTCATYGKKVPTCPSNTPPRCLTGLPGLCSSRGAGAGWLSDMTLAAKPYLWALALQVMLVSRHVLIRTWQQCLQTWPQNSYGQLWKRQRMPQPARQADPDRQRCERIARRSYQRRLWEMLKADDFAPKLFWSIIAIMRAFSTIN